MYQRINYTRYDQRLTSEDKKIILGILERIGERVQLYDICRHSAGPGLWRIELTLIVDDNNVGFSAITADSKLINDWEDDDGKITNYAIVSTVEKLKDQIFLLCKIKKLN